MYGMHVHNAVVANRELKNGITIHYVNKDYDKGAIIFQISCDLDANESPESVKRKVQELEAIHYPKVIDSIL